MCSLVCRVALVGLAMLCTACAVCGLYFPVYHREFGSSTIKTTYTVYYWYADSSVMIGGEPVVTRQYVRNASSGQVRALYLLGFSLAVAGAALGGLTCVSLSCWTCAGYSPCLASGTDFVAFMSFLCCGGAMAVSAALFCTTSYEMLLGDNSVATPYNQEGFHLREGFALMVAATGGFLILSFCVCFVKCLSKPQRKYQPSRLAAL